MYAFAVILHEIIHRQGPFNVSSTTTLDVSLIVDRIRQGPNLNTVGRVECFRPQIKVKKMKKMEKTCVLRFRNPQLRYRF